MRSSWVESQLSRIVGCEPACAGPPHGHAVLGRCHFTILQINHNTRKLQ